MLASFSIWTSVVVRAATFVSLFLCLFVSGSLLNLRQVSAATIDGVNQDAVRIQQQQEQQLEKLEERSRQRRTPAPEAPHVEPPPASPLPEDHLCVAINTIMVEGNSLLSDRQITELTTET